MNTKSPVVSKCGNWGSQVEYDELEAMPIEPYEAGGSRHHPVKHSQVCQTVEDTFNMLGYKTEGHDFFVSKDKHRMLCTFDLHSPSPNIILNNDEMKMVGAVINTTNSTIAPQVLFGNKVFVCDNLTFCAEFRVRHKSTPSILSNIKYLLIDKIDELPNMFSQITTNFSSMKDCGAISDSECNDLLVRSAERNIIGFQQIPGVKKHWDEPEHEEFKARNLYSFYNCFTSYWRGKSPFSLRNSSKKLDQFVGSYMENQLNYELGKVNHLN